MLNKLDDFPIHQTPEPIAHPATSDRNVYDRTWFNGYAADGSDYFGIGMAIYPHRGILDCAFSVVRAGRAPALLLRLAPRAARAHRHAGRAVPAGGHRADEAHPRRARRQRQRHRLRPHLLGPHRGDPGSPADPVDGARRIDGRHPLRPVRPLERHRRAPRRRVRGRRGHLPRHQGPLLGRARRRRAREPAARRACRGGIFFLWAPLFWDDHITHAIFFDGQKGEALVREGIVAPLYASEAEVPGVEDGRDQRMATAAPPDQVPPGHAAGARRRRSTSSTTTARRAPSRSSRS